MLRAAVLVSGLLTFGAAAASYRRILV